MIKDLTAATPNAARLPKDVKVKLMTRQKEIIKQAEYLRQYLVEEPCANL